MLGLLYHCFFSFMHESILYAFLFEDCFSLKLNYHGVMMIVDIKVLT